MVGNQRAFLERVAGPEAENLLETAWMLVFGKGFLETTVEMEDVPICCGFNTVQDFTCRAIGSCANRAGRQNKHLSVTPLATYLPRGQTPSQAPAQNKKWAYRDLLTPTHNSRSAR